MIKVIILGIFFGMILQRSRINTFEKIGGFAMLKDFTVPKVLLTSIGIGAILLFIEIQSGFAVLHVKPFNLVGIVLGGIVFGIGMAILGYCPGTLIVSLGEGSLDTLVGILGGLVAGFLFTLFFPSLNGLLGPNLGKLNLYGHNLILSVIIVLIFGIAAVLIAFRIDRMESRQKE